MSNPIMVFFNYKHLPPHLQRISKPIREIAFSIDDALPDSAEKSAGMRKLLEAKDCFVRCAIEPYDQMEQWVQRSTLE